METEKRTSTDELSPPRNREGSSESPRRSRSRSNSRGRYQSASRSRSRSRARSPSPRGRGKDKREKPAAEPSSVLGVFGLSHYTRQRDLEDIFGKYGKLKEAILVVDKRSNQSRGFGFIYFENQEDAERALRETNGMRLDGRYIRVDFSATQRAHSPTPGKYMGERRDRSRDRHYRRDYRRGYRSRSRGGRRSRSRSRDRHYDRYYDDRRGNNTRRYSRSRSRSR